ncbi:MAG: PP2C family protein-serine/threonine phosphatase [Leucobacter sp.]
MNVPSTDPVFEFAAHTDPGVRRAVNEDSVLATIPCFLVADGMGGHDSGNVVSKAALHSFAESIPQGRPATLKLVHTALEASRAAAERIAAEASRGAGCTLTGVVLVEYEDELHWLILNIGDSRVYLHRGSELQQLTVDHSLRDELLSAGADEASLPSRNIITRALGASDSRADTWLLPVETGSRLLVCSDGLTSELDDEQIRATLTMGGTAEAVVTELIQRANEAGGRDNVTVIVIDTISGGRSWHIGSERSSRSFSLIDETLESTLPRKRIG